MPLFCRNLFQQQKLLSVGLDESLPLGRQSVEDLIESMETKEKIDHGAEPHIQGGGVMQDIDSNSVFPVLAFIGTGLVLLFLLNQYYRGRSKPRRKRPRLKKIHTLLYGTKGPSVWHKLFLVAKDIKGSSNHVWIVPFLLIKRNKN